MNLSDITEKFNTEDKARDFLESVLWPHGAVCPHCGVIGESYRLNGKAAMDNKAPVVTLVERNGQARSFHVEQVCAKNLRPIIKEHLHRYLSEFDFRYNARDVSDGERTEKAIQNVVGKRLMYRPRLDSQN